jgi:glycine/D-amino acid oxidase-like deaminating enzyme
MLPRAQSLWLATSPETDYPPLSGGLSADVAVLGGGIVGITAALLLRNAGLKVALVESNRIAQGVSGHTAGKITSLHQTIYSHLISAFGTEKARLYGEANQTAIETIAAWVQAKKIDCDFVRKLAYTYAESPEALEMVEQEVRSAQVLGLPASFADKLPLPFQTLGAVCFSSQAQFHPRKYLLSLALSFVNDGGLIFEKTRALDIAEGEPCQVVTDRGTLKAKDIIISSHFPFYDRTGFYASHLFPQRTYMLAVQTNQPFPDGMFIGSNDWGHSLRSQPEAGTDLVLIGGEDHPVEQISNINHHQEMAKFAYEMFGSPDIKYRWAGSYNNTFDRVPYIGKLTSKTEHLFVATGFGGWGMTNGTVAGILLRDLVLRRPNPWSTVYDPARLERHENVDQ